MISLRLPNVDFGNQPVGAFDAAIETLAFEHADLDLDHVEPAGVLGRVVELEPAEHAARFGGGKAGRARRRCGSRGCRARRGYARPREIDIDEVAHAEGEVVSGAPIGDLDLAPRAVDVKEDEEIGGAVAAILVVVALDLPRLRPGSAGALRR